MRICKKMFLLRLALRRADQASGNVASYREAKGLRCDEVDRAQTQKRLESGCGRAPRGSQGKTES